MSIDPSRSQFKRFAVDFPQDAPIQMLNLIRFKPLATYPMGHPLHNVNVTGREAYATYQQQLGEFLKQHASSARIVYAATPLLTVTGPETEQWDECFVMEYPTAKAFLAMVKNPVYSESIVVHRTAAVADSRLIRMAKL